MITVAILVVIVTVLLVKYVKQFVEYRAIFNKLPGEKSFHILLGNMHMYPGPNEAGVAYDFERSKQFKYFHRTWAGPFVPVILTYHPDVIKVVLKSSAPKPRNKYLATPYDMGLRWLGEGLLIANGARWARSRRLLSPAFHFDILKPYVDVYNSCGRLLVDKIGELAGKNESFDLFTPVGMCALDVILQCAFSYKSDCQTKGQNKYTAALAELVKLWTDRSFQPHLFFEPLYGLTSQGQRFYKLCDDVHAVAEEIIEKRRKALENEEEKQKVYSKKVKDFLDTLLMARDETGKGMTFLEIRNEVDTFMFEGHDTTTSGMTWTLYCLAKHPEYQERVYEEVISVLGDRDEIEWDDLPHLEFTTICIKETLRLYPAVPFIERKLHEDMVFNGHTIPEGTLTAIHINMLHHNPHLWDQPNEFVPERFHPDKQCLQDPFQFIPFSAGSRNCIGQNFAMNEMKVTIAKVIKNFKLTVDPEYEPQRFMSVTLRAEQGVRVFATHRDKT